MRPPTYVTGLDLGQTADYSALVTVEVDTAGPEFAVRHLHRWPLGTKYPQVVADVGHLFGQRPLSGSTLVIDGTGVGKAVADMFAPAGITADVKAFTITAGLAPGDGTVPKKDLVGAVQVALQNGQLKIARGLPLADTLARELETFRVKVTADRNETFAAWRERDHDDLVLALALAVWYAGLRRGDRDCYTADSGATPFDGLPADLFR